MQSQEVQFGAVTFVLGEAILRKGGAEVAHNFIARDLGDDAGGGDAEAEAIAVNDGGLREGERGDGPAVDERVLGRWQERAQGEAHGFVGGAKDVDGVDLDGIDDADGPHDGGVGDEFAVNFLTPLGQKLLGIVQPSMPEFFRQDNGSGHDGTGERAATGFIDTGYAGDAERAQSALMPESATTIHRATRMG